jgi:hypothetical protein
MILTSKESGGNFEPHPEGIHPAVCVDVMDLGLVETEFNGERKMVNKLKLVFESEQQTADGKPCTVTKSFTASLHPKAKLAEFLGKWRGKLVTPGETIDLGKLIGASCTLVISHQQSQSGKTYAAIDAVSKPTKKLTPSGTYDGAAARQRYNEWRAKEGHAPVPGSTPAAAPAPAPKPAPAKTPTKSAAAAKPQPAAEELPIDPEIGF